MSDLQTFTPLWSCFKLKLFFCLHLVDWDFVCTFQVLLLPGVACSQHWGYSVKEGNRPHSPETIFHFGVFCEEQDAKSLTEFRSAWTLSPPRTALMLADKPMVAHLVVLPHVKNRENHLGKLLSCEVWLRPKGWWYLYCALFLYNVILLRLLFLFFFFFTL